MNEISPASSPASLLQDIMGVHPNSEEFADAQELFQVLIAPLQAHIARPLDLDFPLFLSSLCPNSPQYHRFKNITTDSAYVDKNYSLGDILQIFTYQITVICLG